MTLEFMKATITVTNYNYEKRRRDSRHCTNYSVSSHTGKVEKLVKLIYMSTTKVIVTETLKEITLASATFLHRKFL